MVSAEEKALIGKAIKASGAKNIREYLTSMAINGYVIQVDTDAIRQALILLRNISTNVNQLARRANETRNIYAEDIEDLRLGYSDVLMNLGEAITALKRLK